MRLSDRVPARALVMGLLVAVSLAGAVLFGLGGGSRQGDDRAGDTSDTIAPGATTTQVVTSVTSQASSTTTGPPSTTAPSTPSVIPGLTVDDLRSGLTDQGWICGPATDQSSPGYVIWACYEPAGSPWLQVIATPAGEVVFVEMLAMSNSEYQWLEYIAALPWDGAEPEPARSWVQLMTTGASGTLGLDLYVNRFGGVRYEISGQPGLPMTMTLSLGSEPP